MPIEYRTGDLFKTEIEAIAHGCNARGYMGAGIALQFKRRFPEVYKEYKTFCDGSKAYNVPILGKHCTHYTKEKRVYSLITQLHPGPCASIEAIETSLLGALRLERAITENKAELAIPRIGCGLGGLSWAKVQPVFERVAKAAEARLVVFTFT